MKKIKSKFFLPGFIVVIFLISGCNHLSQEESENLLVVIGNQKFAYLLENEKGFFVYIGRPNCPVCEELEPVLEETLVSLNKELYYYNTDEARQEDEEKMMELLQLLGVVSVPTIIYLEDGQVVEKLHGLQSANDLRVFFES